MVGLAMVALVLGGMRSTSAQAQAAQPAPQAAPAPAPSPTAFDCNALDLGKLTEEQIEAAKAFCLSLKPKELAEEQPVEATDEIKVVSSWQYAIQKYSGEVELAAARARMSPQQYMNTGAGVMLTVALFIEMFGSRIVWLMLSIFIWVMANRVYKRTLSIATKWEPRRFLIVNYRKAVEWEAVRDMDNSIITGLLTAVGATVITGSLWALLG
jgi:hypothetical protein